MSHAHPGEFEGAWWRYPLVRNGLVAGLFAILGLILERWGRPEPWGSVGCFLLAILLASPHWAREAIEDLFRERVVGIDLLMLAALVGASALGMLDEAAWLAVLYSLAEGIEDYAYARTRSAIRGLLTLAPKTARLLRDGAETTVAAESLRVGDRFLVRPGESFATDGVIRAGRTTIDEASVTGESTPVEKTLGDHVYAGTLNQVGALEVEATATFSDNTLAKVIHLVERAQERKGQAQQWVERFGRRYSPAVLLASACLLLAPLAFSLPFMEWAHRAVVLLVAASPCALVISMPIAMAVGIGRAGRRGVLVKGGAHLEHLAKIQMVAFDKTGTLTEGRPRVTDVLPVETDRTRLLAIAGALERFSEHPLARAIVAEAEENGVESLSASDSQVLSGAGTEATLAGARWYAGSPALFRARGHTLGGLEAEILTHEQEGKTVVLVGTDRVIAGVMALRDVPRPAAYETVLALRDAGLCVAMLTGDNRHTAQAIAGRLGIAEVHAELKPADKVRVVEEYSARFSGGVLMVGDGINDAPALAAATCGVAMGAIGSDAAIEAADVALVSNDLGRIPEALELAKHVRSVSRQNVAFSLLLLAVLIPAALLGVVGVAATVAVHEVGELLAVANGLRAGRV